MAPLANSVKEGRKRRPQEDFSTLSLEDISERLITYFSEKLSPSPYQESTLVVPKRTFYNEQWYFRGAWMGRELLPELGRRGLVERAGTYHELMSNESTQRVFPQGKVSFGALLSPVFHKVVDKKLNERISSLFSK